MSDKRLIEAGKNTPFVLFDKQEAVFELKGRSSPEVSINFYSPIYDWLDSYTPEGSKDLTAKFALEYFNTSSTKCLMGILKRLKKIQAKGQNVIINWLYEEDDEDILEIGEDLEYVVDIPFNYIPVEVDDDEYMISY